MAMTQRGDNLRLQKSQSSSSVTMALPITYDDPDPEQVRGFRRRLRAGPERLGPHAVRAATVKRSIRGCE